MPCIRRGLPGGAGLVSVVLVDLAVYVYFVGKRYNPFYRYMEELMLQWVEARSGK